MIPCSHEGTVKDLQGISEVTHRPEGPQGKLAEPHGENELTELVRLQSYRQARQETKGGRRLAPPESGYAPQAGAKAPRAVVRGGYDRDE